ncbi:MAG TPA: zinc ribbon domain-containing protein [Pirellulales bacterium]|nr:zinc ribbon domain-containing protein [Pirellulales bacterium]
MPTYEYHCEKCDHTFEKVQSIKDNALTVCPKEDCPRKPWGKGKIKRVIGAGAGLLFKGSGFYITDYRSENYKAAAKKESGASEAKPSGSEPAKSTGGSPAKTDTKSESKPAPTAKKNSSASS